jgi:perosamine synthetase
MSTIPPVRPVFSKDDREAVAKLVDETLSTGRLTLGPQVEQFEQAFALRHGTRFGVATSTGTSALEILFRCLHVQGKEVLVPSNTFLATAAAALHAGGIVRLADVDARTLALSARTVEAALTDRCAAVVVVHIGGLVSSDVDEIASLCRRRGVFLVEDAAHAHGSGLAGRPAGSFGHAGAFSFYPTKVMTSGEGGMIVTDDETLADAARMQRDHGKRPDDPTDHLVVGGSWRMSELHAVVGLVQLARLDEFVTRRRQVAEAYDQALAGLGGITSLTPPPRAEPNYYKHIALLDPGIDRMELKRGLRDRHGVSLSGEVYAVPLHRQPVLSPLVGGRFPTADDVCARHLCLPVLSDMTDREVDHVVASLAQELRFFRGQRRER